MDKNKVKILLEEARNELLELSRRSPLINFKTNKTRGINFSLPNEFINTLVEDRESFYFVSEEDNSKHYKNKVAIGLSKKDLHKKLLNIYYNYKFYLEERGVNSLFIALGLLKWEDNDKTQSSPLILIPVEFFRKGINSSFYFQYNDGDYGVNLSLKYKLQKEFKLTLPEFDGDLTKFYKELEVLIKDNGWQIDPNFIHLGFFAYGRFLMFNDLDETQWVTKSLTDNENLNKLLNEGFFKKSDAKDHLNTKKDLPYVVDVDSSQLKALSKIKSGMNLIIQGPPGTGKSQTITNIIAQALADNKTVLFVSDKKAALDVVKNRLEKISLGRFCLELHSHKANKKEFMQDLKQTLKDRWDNREYVSSNDLRLVKLEEDLSVYGRELVKKYKITNYSAFDVFGKILLHKQKYKELFTYYDKNITEVSQEELIQKKLILDAYIKLYLKNGLPSENIFYGAQIQSMTPFDLENLVEQIQSVIKNLEGRGVGEYRLVEFMGVIEEEKASATHFSNYNLLAVDLGFLKTLCQQIEEFKEKYKYLGFARVLELADYFKSHTKFHHKLSINYWSNSRLLTRNKFTIEELIFDVDKYLQQILKFKKYEMQPSVKDYVQYNNEVSQLIDFLEKPEVYQLIRKDLKEFSEISKNIKQIQDRFIWSEMTNRSISSYLELLERTVRSKNKIYDQITFNKIKHQMMDHKLEDLLKVLLEKPQYTHLAKELYEYNYWLYLTKQFFKNEAFVSFNNEILDALNEDYKLEDSKFIKNNRERLLMNHRSLLRKLLEQAGGLEEEFNLILKELAKKQRHLPIRHILEKSGRLIQKIKPIMMMSPISVATYLPPGKITFDLVIFDEASQVKPVEAFGAIGRAKQMIVVGDSKQLPPTNFFENQIDNEELDEENDLQDLESILDLASSKGVEQVMLNWHYRSQHPSLIQTSNKEFYNDELVVLPSPVVNSDALGLKYNYVDGVYDRGGTRENLLEAKAIAEAVMEHAKNSPEVSLGVVAFSMPQTQLIIEEVEKLRQESSDTESFFNADNGFFIKNLENVQGDERDVIFISVGYGKDASGKLHLDFGPINKSGGERRLNVLISRAKQKCVVFTGIKGSDIDLSKTNSKGVAVLKSFLHYAQFNQQLFSNTKVENNEALEYLKIKIQEKGFKVIPHFGHSQFDIDLVVLNSKNEVLMGIVLDGTLYHRFKSPRDRELVYPSAIKQMKWNIYSVYVVNLIRHPEEELLKIFAQLEAISKPNEA